jgi:RHS repeat-associated protein
MTWDDLNRMKSVQGTQDGSVNFYRADGLRARRVTGIGIGFNVDDQGAVSGYYDTYSLDRPTWRYYHDGQAPFEDDKTHDPGEGKRKDVTRYALGARGGDMAETVLSMGMAGERTVRSYPLYDGHGNTVGQVARAEEGAPDASFAPVPGAPAFKLGARRKYDAWGQLRWSEGAPAEQGYCGNLQHRRDAESGLVYMRARYYEPWTGRLVSEDPARDGHNWFVYCGNDPVNKVDPTGFYTSKEVADFVFSVLGLCAALFMGGAARVAALAGISFLVCFIFQSFSDDPRGINAPNYGSSSYDSIQCGLAFMTLVTLIGVAGLDVPMAGTEGSVLVQALGVVGAYSATLTLTILWLDL